MKLQILAIIMPQSFKNVPLGTYHVVLVSVKIVMSALLNFTGRFSRGRGHAGINMLQTKFQEKTQRTVMSYREMNSVLIVQRQLMSKNARQKIRENYLGQS